ncbi:MAG: DegT/DnrJ/EryC1/StrS family aminotransferase [Saprospiraceae bacterium]
MRGAEHSNDRIPFLDFGGMHDPLKEAFMDSLSQFLDTKWYVLGNAVRQFESAYAQFIGQQHSVGVSSGMAALHLALRAAGIGPGDEVIVPANTYIATWLAVSYVGAKLVPVDPDPVTGNFSAELVARALTPASRAIIPVHLYGMPCPMDELMALADRHQLWVIEDNAQAHGATVGIRRTGSFGHLNAHSFYPTKVLGALGEAGAITTDDHELADQLCILRNYGQRKRYENEVIGYNYRLDEIQATFLNVKMHHLANWIAERRQLANTYHQGLQDLEGLRLPPVIAGLNHVYHLYVIHSDQRDELQQWLSEKKIETIVHYPKPPHRQSAYAQDNWPERAFPVANRLAATCLSLPLYIGMPASHQMRVIEAIQAFWKRRN